MKKEELMDLIEDYKHYGYKLVIIRPAVWWKDGLIAEHVAIMKQDSKL